MDRGVHTGWFARPAAQRQQRSASGRHVLDSGPADTAARSGGRHHHLLQSSQCGSQIQTLRIKRHEARLLERFPAKWIPVRVKKTRQNKNLEPRSDSIGTGL